MVITFIEEDIFTSKCQTLVNPVNCMGVMGNGLSKEFKKRFPACEAPYKAACDNHLLQPGKLMIWRGQSHWVLQFPTKDKWWNGSHLSYIEEGLKKFAATYKQQGIESAAFPMLGAGLGKLPKKEVKALLVKYLEPLDIPCEVYEMK